MITLSQANAIVAAALEQARAMGLPPMTVAVLNAGGHLVAFQMEDESSLFREKIARAKAYGCLGLGAGSRQFVGRAESHPHFFNALLNMTDGAIAPVPGGVLVRSPEGRIVGAVGVSGQLPDNDEKVAVAGVEAAGLKADVGQ